MVALFFSIILETVSASPFRVLVFPHQGSYPIPQGKESIVSKVSITSEEVCHRYQAVLNSNQEWEKSGNLIESKKNYLLSTSLIGKNSFYFECSKPFKVIRDAKLEAYSYEGNFVASVDSVGATAAVQIINLVEPEQYIQGVVPSEVGNNWPAEALKSQAVAARTFAWWTVLNQRSFAKTNFDLNDTVEYQAFLGVSKKTTLTDEAVNATAHQVMKYQGRVIKSYFSADSGGTTESALGAFGQDLPYCVSKVELYDVSKTKTAWEIKLSLNEIRLKINNSIKSLEVLPGDLDESGRVSLVTFTLLNGKKAQLSGVAFRRALKLRSTLFSLKTETIKNQDFITISGKGFGHGVGMAQIGAREYANQLGWNFDQILKFYYSGITLEAISNEYFE
jgi:stage II sporulation protein D